MPDDWPGSDSLMGGLTPRRGVVALLLADAPASGTAVLLLPYALGHDVVAVLRRESPPQYLEPGAWSGAVTFVVPRVYSPGVWSEAVSFVVVPPAPVIVPGAWSVAVTFRVRRRVRPPGT